MEIIIRHTISSDIDYISKHMRLADKKEVYRASGNRPRRALELARKVSECWTGLIDGVPVAIFGCSGADSVTGRGSPWMLGTDEIKDHGVAIAGISKRFVAFLQQSYYYLENYVDCDNELSIKWLKWLGFSFDDPCPYGLFGKSFMKFYWKSEDVYTSELQ